MEDFYSRNSSEDQKKKKKQVFSKDGRLFSLNSSEDQRSDADQSQIIADADHTQVIGGDTVKLLGGYIPPGFGTFGPRRFQLASGKGSSVNLETCWVSKVNRLCATKLQ